ncbi:STAS/SEC14 domain-containing protein [Shewanella sp. 6_MG-2023]|uniref:STAS/SEC14 domain-containing protein n=1 Tax=Shewanella sp. 6_MG-2023 TaxID=3062660 RepID=UPI0026E3BE88|nr:STAS/SEC14 domain-containing protein [Shewanella sp. 6_MG-2023]MDO6620136.1 STAS/SEC14 domain-containing protein [Shewanella sp. 6_MG-2023]
MSSVKTHGLSIGIERVKDDVYLSLKATGTLTHNDYLVITPLLDAALAEVKHPKVNVFIDGTELDGWELRAAWDDLKLGLQHNNEFKKVAIWGNKNWQNYSAKVAAWFMSGEVQFFEEKAKALAWLEK